MSYLPLPVSKDKNNVSVKSYTRREWYEKLSEELLEAHATSGDDEAEELVDIIAVAISYLNATGYDAVAREALYRRVNDKNYRRGYFDE